MQVVRVIIYGTVDVDEVMICMYVFLACTR